ncbi:hypothetical protein FOB64_004943 [Candida albicans]|uniref:Protein LST4 n=1 Tax=Candida albicans TaxID=5476 RepID=A0A8H6BXI7_CANAX|nr:hypothetical protein FOB64_004943 [Candida albicans]
MLGRLFKQNNNTTQPHNPHHQPPIQSSSNPTTPPALTSSYEDSYTREILYGTHNANQLKPYQFNSKLFRIIISQDGGNLRTKQVLYDTTTQQQTQDFSNFKRPVSPKTMKSGKIYHNMSDLNDYMFGCGLPSNENHSATKLHVLPPLTNSMYGPYPAVLITRLFSISDGEFIDSSLFSSTETKEWQPNPALVVKESSIRKVSLKDDTSKNNNVNSRFAIGIVIPLESLGSLIDIHTYYTGCQYLINKRIQFPNFILQHDNEIGVQKLKLIKTIHYNYNVPKLINSNTLMKSSVTKDLFQYNPMLVNWVLELLNWLEFKDGRYSDHSNSFLGSLFAILTPFKKSLSLKPFYNSSCAKKEVTRVVVMTGNPVVARKLVFILNGLIPNSQPVKISEVDNLVENNANGEDHAVKPITIQKSGHDQKTQNQDHYHALPPQPGSCTISESSSNNSLTKSTPSFKGWEIPNKGSTSITMDPCQVETTLSSSSATGIPIRGTSSPGSLSMAYLSSSLNSSYSSSNYSLSKLGGSFMEKWKNSFGSVSSTVVCANGSGQNHTTTAVTNGSYFDDLYNFSKRTSPYSLRTPSPAVEFDEYNFSSTKPINIVNNSLSSNFQSQLSMTPSRLSRTQSMYDLYGNKPGGMMNVMTEEEDMSEAEDIHQKSESNSSTNSNNNNAVTGMSTLELKRTKTSVIIPLIQDNMIKNISEHNQSLIKEKCKLNMEHKLKMNRVVDDNVLQVESPCIRNGTSHNEHIVFKNKTLIPVVAFSDEFRPEFNVQSCPINPKLEQQVMAGMKQDLLFYQNNSNYDEIVSRTIFISLRAREIKLIEMNINNKDNKAFSLPSSPTKQMTNNNGTTSTTTNNTYKTKIKKIYTPTKNNGNKELINKIEKAFSEIGHLFAIQQQLYQQHNNNPNRTNDSGYNNSEITKREFHEKLCKLVLQIIN